MKLRWKTWLKNKMVHMTLMMMVWETEDEESVLVLLEKLVTLKKLGIFVEEDARNKHMMMMVEMILKMESLHLTEVQSRKQNISVFSLH